MNKEQFLAASVSNFSQVYMGKQNICRCGCAGKYTATTYMDNPRTSTIDDNAVARMLRRAQKLLKEGADADTGSNYFEVTTGDNRCLTFYFDELKSNTTPDGNK